MVWGTLVAGVPETADQPAGDGDKGIEEVYHEAEILFYALAAAEQFAAALKLQGWIHAPSAAVPSVSILPSW